jgi:aryl-alcohol dehydrogenase-like predicted oxidoreductase
MSYGDKRWQDWVIEEDESLPLIKKAYDAGINFFDTGALIYQTFAVICWIWLI